MSPQLDGNTAVVTGAGRGIGRVIAKTLAANGACVVAAARTSEEIDSLAAEITDNGAKAIAVRTDVTNEASVEQLFSEIDNKFGRVDILINNAGMGIFSHIIDCRSEDFDRVLAVNVGGAFLCSREALKRMIPQKSGYIINISSVLGVRAYINQGAYTAAKHGVMGLTKTLALEGQPHGIRVSAILPGGVNTEMIAKSRPDLDASALLEPEDIAGAMMYLLGLSEKASVDQIYIRRRNSSPF
ncbi:MAG: SDR family oxidoreductase [Phycisphaerae bacterium]|jgi:NAD(P)-dependent dehydrogenase (short-subunit alcohol dehydrogenase family)|nr:SDR family oxidoreductase [Phycisphaerae bacterium]